SLLLAVKQVAALAEKGPQPAGTQPPYRWTLAQTSGQLLEGELYLERSAAGPFVAADFGSDRVAPNLLEIAQSRRLTPAETEVLSDLVRGCSDAEIAGHRFVSMATVRTHVTRVIQKLGVRSRLQAAALALGASPTKENLNQKL
ncbi:helix-turn-helix transcriptional regulator, partial [bacterium]